MITSTGRITTITLYSSLPSPSSKSVNFDLTSHVALTQPHRDSAGRISQIWCSKGYLRGSVYHPDGRIQIIKADKILLPTGQLPEEELILRLALSPNSKWDIAYMTSSSSLMIWPHLVAAGGGEKEDVHYRHSPFRNMSEAQVRELFESRLNSGETMADGGLRWTRAPNGDYADNAKQRIYHIDTNHPDKPPHVDVKLFGGRI